MQQEDDLRGLARVMDFMRAVSILFVGINVYWFCYSTLKEWGVTFEVIDKILWNFQRTTGLFSSVLWTKLFAVVFLALSCIGTKGVKEEKITWTKIHCSLVAGVVLFFRCHIRRMPCFISPRFRWAISVCSWRVRGCPGC